MFNLVFNIEDPYAVIQSRNNSTVVTVDAFWITPGRAWVGQGIKKSYLHTDCMVYQDLLLLRLVLKKSVNGSDYKLESV